jgi:hypothetical protein
LGRLPTTGDRSAIIAESSRLRSIAWSAFYRFKLTSPGDSLAQLVERAVQKTADVTDADDKDELKRRSAQARKYIDELANAAATHLAEAAAKPGHL